MTLSFYDFFSSSSLATIAAIHLVVVPGGALLLPPIGS